MRPTPSQASTCPAAPPDLWTRLAKLHATCMISLSSVRKPRHTGASVGWQLSIRRRTALPGEEPIVVTHPKAIETIATGLREAEARNWHQKEKNSAPQHACRPAILLLVLDRLSA